MQEQIVLANFSKEENLINFYKKGFTDMHSYIAFLMYPDIRRSSVEDLTPENLTYLKEAYPDKRKIAKSAGFSINYGGDGSTIAKNCNLSKSEGSFVYESYFEAFPNLRTYFDLVFKRASHFGYIQFNPVTKRKYFFDKQENYFFKYKDDVEDDYFWQTTPDAKSIFNKYNGAKTEMSRLSQNYPVQGSAADITKYAGILFFKEILKAGMFGKIKLVNMIHDEYLMEAHEKLTPVWSEKLRDCMALAGKAFCKTIPLGASADIGDHWIH